MPHPSAQLPVSASRVGKSAGLAESGTFGTRASQGHVLQIERVSAAQGATLGATSATSASVSVSAGDVYTFPVRATHQRATERRIAPAGERQEGRTCITGFSNATIDFPATVDEPEEKERILAALENMTLANPPHLFAERYRLKDERVVGGQAVVVFARDDCEGFFQYAIKCASSRSLL